MYPQVVTFGESLGLFVPSSDHQALEYTSQVKMSFGGAESNVAIGLARLGVSVGWCGRLGNDSFGRQIYRTLRSEGVDVSNAILVDDEQTGLMFREQSYGRLSVFYYRKESAMTRISTEEIDEQYIKQAKIIHLTGITPMLSTSSRQTVLQVLEIAKQNNVRVTFDPNIRLKLWSIEDIRNVFFEILPYVDYLISGFDEAKLLFSIDDESAMIEHVKSLTIPTVIKGIENENWLLTDGKVYRFPFYHVDQVVDEVGAGDAFAAGFIAGLCKGETIEDCMRIGAITGALSIQMPGDWEGLPTWNQTENLRLDRKHIAR